MSSKHANPQGKGLIPIMESLLASRVQVNIPAKNFEQIACELFTSLFILKSEFKYKPIIGRSNWLYRKNDIFRLSLIKPQEWRNDSFGQFIGECIMQEDMTWTFSLSKEAMADEELIQHIEYQRQKFEKNLTNQHRLKQALPVYDAKLPFYQRIFASGLAYSLGISLDKHLAKELESKSYFLNKN
jgi:hypothetical protein